LVTDEVALEIDKQIYQNYYLHPSNFIAAGQLNESVSESDKQAFACRIEGVKAVLRPTVLKMYRHPVNNQNKFL